MEQDKHTAEAYHLAKGDQHIVGVKSLRVFISQEDGLWFAQGLDIDYAAAGETVESAEMNFRRGLIKTITEYLKLHGSIEKFLKQPPQEALTEYYAANPNHLVKKVTTVQFDNLSENTETIPKSNFPFKDIEYLLPAAA